MNKWKPTPIKPCKAQENNNDIDISFYKGELELWYLKHLSFYTDFMLMFLTVWVIVFKDNDVVYRVFKDLPPKPAELK